MQQLRFRPEPVIELTPRNSPVAFEQFERSARNSIEKIIHSIGENYHGEEPCRAPCWELSLERNASPCRRSRSKSGAQLHQIHSRFLARAHFPTGCLQCRETPLLS